MSYIFQICIYHHFLCILRHPPPPPKKTFGVPFPFVFQLKYKEKEKKDNKRLNGLCGEIKRLTLIFFPMNWMMQFLESLNNQVGGGRGGGVEGEGEREGESPDLLLK